MYDELILFVKIVKLGSFTKASKCTGVSPSNLTRRIQKLEQMLNFVLLKRDTRAIELSVAGKQLYDKFCNLESELSSIITHIEETKNDISGLINVLLPPCFALNVITPHLIKFLNQFPKISLNITYHSCQINLVKDNFDLAVLNHRPIKSTQKIKLLCRGKIIFYCYPEYIEKFGLPATQEDLEKTTLIGVVLDHEIHDKKIFLVNQKTGHKEVFNHTYRILQNSGIHDQELAKTGQTIGVGIDIMLQQDIKSGNIIHVLPDYYIPGFEYYLLTNPEGKNARTSAFISFLDECIQNLHLDKDSELPKSLTYD